MMDAKTFVENHLHLFVPGLLHLQTSATKGPLAAEFQRLSSCTCFPDLPLLGQIVALKTSKNHSKCKTVGIEFSNSHEKSSGHD